MPGSDVPATGAPLDRRRFVVGATLTVAAAAVGGAGAGAASPSFALRRRRGPTLTSGVQAGDVSDDGAVLWARASAPGRMWASVATTDSGRGARVIRGPVVADGTDFTGQVRVGGLRPGQRLAYRIWFEDEDGVAGAAESGSFRTPPRRFEPVSFVWSGDCAGQGWGINPDCGGMRGLRGDARQRSPTSSSAAATPSTPTARSRPRSSCPTARVWRNIITAEKSKVAETLAEFRGNFRYNLLDENVRRFNAQVPVDRPVGRPRGAQQLVSRARSSTTADAVHGEDASTSSPAARGAGVQRVLPDSTRSRRRAGPPQ